MAELAKRRTRVKVARVEWLFCVLVLWNYYKWKDGSPLYTLEVEGKGAAWKVLDKF